VGDAIHNLWFTIGVLVIIHLNFYGELRRPFNTLN